LVAALKRHGAGSRVLDYGTGWGGLVIRLRAAGFDAFGYDLSQEMVKFCQDEGLPIRLGDIHDVTERGLDAIVLASVFEHLNDPADWLREAGGRLRPAGLLVTTQPTAPFARAAADLVRVGIRRLPLPGLHQIFCPPWHVALYSLEGMKQVVERAGFRLVEVTPAPQQREPGLTGIVQRALETVNRAGWALMGLKWPFFTGHIFVFRRA
jgi:cyclopropane fatty-acyl-phospholipid synthase-like methyltransferase